MIRIKYIQGAHTFLRNQNKTFIRPQLEENKTFQIRKSMILTNELKDYC